jgi:hypothetical protein
MQKKYIIIIAVLFIALLVALGIIVLMSKNPAAQTSVTNTQSTSTLPNVASENFFTLAVSAYQGSYYGVLTLGGSSTTLSQQAVEKYALVSFSSTMDLLWFQCPEGYVISNALSTTGNKVTKVGSEVNIELSPSLPNNITVTCQKHNS